MPAVDYNYDYYSSNARKINKTAKKCLQNSKNIKNKFKNKFAKLEKVC